MPSPGSAFLSEILDATAAVDAVMAEPWKLQPRAQAVDVNAAWVPDASRAAVLFMATFLDSEAKAEEPNSYDRRQVRRPGIESGKALALVSPAARLVMGVPIRKSDRIVRQSDGAVWLIANSFEMSGGTLKLHLNIVG